MLHRSVLALAAMLSLAAPAVGQEMRTQAQAPASKPSLIVAIAVDQFSADLFSQYRATFNGGLKRLAQGVVFPQGYQSHAATETCPGHATILTGVRPGRSGIIANYWIDQSIAREDKRVYCAEDPAVPGSSSKSYMVSLKRLRAETLGDRMKATDPASRVIALSGKDRAAVMMGGHRTDQIWWWGPKGFATFTGLTTTPTVDRVNTEALATLSAESAPLPLPAHCAALDHPVAVTAIASVGNGRFARKTGDLGAFRSSPALDQVTLDLADALLDDQALGRRGHVDLLAISLSATDYVGHAYGTSGTEMCIQIAQL
ncbi:MAG TPA: alkaline phosphatase family protein, partial [Sphingobium sp.]|nr:alkaline phosphatase family protein [Sphingobium sp.]